jgi:hypothetical protein
MAAKIVGKKLKTVQPAPPPSPVAQLGALQSGIQTKFARLKELRAEIAGLKDRYIEHDKLVEELMPLFIEVYPDKFVTKRSITIGSETYRYSPNFFDEKDAALKARVWKASAHKTGTIE